MQANQTPVIWTVVIVGIVLLAGMFYINSGEVSQTDLNDFETRLATQVSAIPTPTAQGPVIVDTSAFDNAFSDLCTNSDGCGDEWRVKSQYRDDFIDRVREDLEEDDNRDLFRAVEDYLNDLDDNEDIDEVELHRIGKIRASEELDSSFDFSDTMTMTGEFVLEVHYTEDGDGDSNREYFLVTATLDDLEDGIEDSEVRDVNVIEWDNDWSLGSN